MTAAVLQLPRTAQRGAEMEAILVGAALFLKPKAPDFGLMGLRGTEFRSPIWQLAWQIAQRRSEMGLEVSAKEVYFAGARRNRWSDPKVLEQLEAAEGSNTLDLAGLKRVARDFRVLAQSLATAQFYEERAQKIRNGYFDPAVEAGALAGLQNELHNSEDMLVDLTVAQELVFAKWDEHEKNQTSDLLPTGIKRLDEVIGGLPKEFCLLVADAGVGKTAFQDSLLHSLVHLHDGREKRQLLKAALITPEDGPNHVIERWTARDMKWLLRDVGSKERTPDERRLSEEIQERHWSFLQRIFGHAKRNLTIDRLISVLWKARELHGCTFASIDNWNKIKLSGLRGNDHWERVADASDRLQEFAQRAGMTVLMLIHSTEELGQRKQVSATSGLQGGKGVGKDARFRLDLYRKDWALRGQIVKANKLAEPGTVIEFARQATAGLIDPDSGEIVDTKKEAREDRERREEESIARQFARSKKRTAMKAAEIAAAAPPVQEPKEPEAQATLIDVPPMEKPSAQAE